VTAQHEKGRHHAIMTTGLPGLAVCVEGTL
jgi:hypothetical protein